MLISGFLILSLFQSKVHVFDFVDTLKSLTSLYSFPLMLLAIVVEISWYIFVFNLIFHVLIRGLWIGAIGLRYVSGQINLEKLNYSAVFKDYYYRKNIDFDKYVEKLEKLASILFAYTFLLIFMIFSLAFLLAFIFIFLIIFAYIFNRDGLTENSININNGIGALILLPIILFLLLGGILVFFDFITLGSIKRIKNKYISKSYLFIFRFFSIATLSFIWRPILLNFLDTRYTRRMFLFSIPYFILVALILPHLHIETSKFYPDIDGEKLNLSHIYDDHRFTNSYYEEDIITGDFELKTDYVLIPSKIISGNYIEIFIPALDYIDKMNIQYFSPDVVPISNSGISLSGIFGKSNAQLTKKMDGLELEQQKAFINKNLLEIKYALSQAIELKIDSIEFKLSTDDVDFYIHPIIMKEGLICFINISRFSSGKHNLKVTRYYWNEKTEKSTKNDTNKTVEFQRHIDFSAVVPFYKE